MRIKTTQEISQKSKKNLKNIKELSGLSGECPVDGKDL
jgi:hypothetical protein